MDIISILLITAALIGFVGLAYVGGYEMGQASGIDSERELANRRINGLLDELNKLKPRLRYRKVDPRKVGKRRAKA